MKLLVNPVLGPGVTVVSGHADLQSTSTNIEVIPGDVHVSEVRRGGVVVRPARFPVVAAVGVNAEMGPAIWVRRIGRLVPAHAPTAAARVDPDGEPGAGWFVVEKNGVAKGIGEWALTARGGDASEGGAAVGGDRYAREVASWRRLANR